MSGLALRPPAAVALELCLCPAPLASPAQPATATVTVTAGSARASPSPREAGLRLQHLLWEWPRAGRGQRARGAPAARGPARGPARLAASREEAPLSPGSISSAGGQGQSARPSCLCGRDRDGAARSVCPAGIYFGLRSGSLLPLPRGRPGLCGEVADPGFLCGSAITATIWGPALQPEGGWDTLTSAGTRAGS